METELHSKPSLPTSELRALLSIRDRAARHLRKNVLPFWARNTWDASHGGFITHLDRAGKPTGVTDKYLVMQARMIWMLAAAHRHGLRDRGYLKLAEAGVEFLLEKMWDRRFGGFWWSVRADGSPLEKRKWVYGQALAWAERQIVRRSAGINRIT